MGPRGMRSGCVIGREFAKSARRKQRAQRCEGGRGCSVNEVTLAALLHVSTEWRGDLVYRAERGFMTRSHGAKFLGHPIHPMLVVFPLGLLVTSLIFDFIRLGTGNGTWGLVAEYMIGAGIIGGLVAAVFGLIDWLSIPAGTRAKTIGAWHGIGNVIVVLLFAISWAMRRDLPETPGTLPFVLSIVAVLIGAVTGWLGGELVDRLGIGVDEGANPNAPNSLSGGPAGRRAA